MRLLVSVRSAREAMLALRGGADIVDAKEPSRGSLGAVSPRALAEIFRCIPAEREVSVALGDAATREDLLRRVSSIPFSDRPATYLKLGFAGVTDLDLIRRLLAAAVAATAEQESVRIVAVAYAEGIHAGGASPWLVCRAAADAGVAGILLDTCLKHSGNLLTWIPPESLRALVASARAAGLFTAIAGGLRAEHLPAVSGAQPAIVGFRGAVCCGGRSGDLSIERVRQLRSYFQALNSGFVQGVDDRPWPGGETPDVSANLCPPC
jgi:uncharacterized protein (UPF0264 family)